jgi:mannose-1-phosphate guanylyltransferase
MTKPYVMETQKRKFWCIVVADDHGPEYVPMIAGAAKSLPVQYCGFGERTTLFQRALNRAKEIAPLAQIAVTVREEDRARWEPALWCIRPERRFVSDSRLTASLTIAAAILSIAADSVSNVVTILPARRYVADERILSAALDRLQRTLPLIPESVGTLGMVDIDDGIDEDYLVPLGTEVGPGFAVQAMARRPVGWVARHLRQHGAMVASGILTGYAGAFATHVSKQRSGLTKALVKIMEAGAGAENALCATMCRDVPRIVMRSLRWWPPAFSQRAFRVHRCGFRGLHTARAVARVSATWPPTIDLVPQRLAESETQSWCIAQSTSSSELDKAPTGARPSSILDCGIFA